jgi:hypothetical protein
LKVEGGKSLIRAVDCTKGAEVAEAARRFNAEIAEEQDRREEYALDARRAQEPSPHAAFGGRR